MSKYFVITLHMAYAFGTGSGGATMHILNELNKQWGSQKLASKKILLVHTGGQSRRLPQHSVLGKLFARLPLPLERKVCTKINKYINTYNNDIKI